MLPNASKLLHYKYDWTVLIHSFIHYLFYWCMRVLCAYIWRARKILYFFFFLALSFWRCKHTWISHFLSHTVCDCMYNTQKTDKAELSVRKREKYVERESRHTTHTTHAMCAHQLIQQQHQRQQKKTTTKLTDR